MIAVVFPGQGSQKPGMGRELYETQPLARETFERASAAVGRDLTQVCFGDDEETLRQTQNAQPALFVCGVAAWRCYEARVSDRPGAMAGHSVGEYAALVAAGVLTLEDGARLVARRGELMGQLGTERPGGMAAILGLERPALEQVCADCAEAGEVVVANDNCPGQLVISGDVAAVKAACALAQELGAKRALPLNVSGAFHSPLMHGAARELGEAIRATPFGSATPGVRVYSNVTGAPVDDPSLWPALLTRQLEHSVQWTDSMTHLASCGVSLLVECGGGAVLSGLMKRVARETRCASVEDAASLEAALAS
ncbi:MAG: ACP S-malonyltransferase [Fimbriimonadaceae bacterium]|nr:ACP S-malonyltransferase [Fimbriimonadaceae bacterium]